MIAIGSSLPRSLLGEIKKCATADIREYFSRPKTYGNLSKILRSSDYTKKKNFPGDKSAFIFRVILPFIIDRTAKQLREHYIGYLRPNINNTEWKID
jgi:hypothetical protein